MTARAWFLNFDADEELGLGSRYSPRASTTARFAALAERAIGLIPKGDVILGPHDDASGAQGFAFCPTPHALTALERASAKLAPSPSFDVLRAVNARPFLRGLVEPLPGACFVASMSEAEHTLRRMPSDHPARFRSPWGFAGRGNLAVHAPEMSAAQRTWLERTLERDALIELVPWVERDADFGWHGHLSRDGVVVLGEPTLQRCSSTGQWESTERAPSSALGPHERELFTSTMSSVVRALVRAGYWGPFGIDAFRWRDAERATHFFPLCDLNARYSMGWAIGMADRRPDLE